MAALGPPAAIGRGLSGDGRRFPTSPNGRRRLPGPNRPNLAKSPVAIARRGLNLAPAPSSAAFESGGRGSFATDQFCVVATIGGRRTPPALERAGDEVTRRAHWPCATKPGAQSPGIPTRPLPRQSHSDAQEQAADENQMGTYAIFLMERG